VPVIKLLNSETQKFAELLTAYPSSEKGHKSEQTEHWIHAVTPLPTTCTSKSQICLLCAVFIPTAPCNKEELLFYASKGLKIAPGP